MTLKNRHIFADWPTSIGYIKAIIFRWVCTRARCEFGPESANLRRFGVHGGNRSPRESPNCSAFRGVHVRRPGGSGPNRNPISDRAEMGRLSCRTLRLRHRHRDCADAPSPLPLALRQVEGFLQSLFGMLGLELDAPDHTTLSRRGQHFDLPRVRSPTGTGLHLFVDSTGLSILGEGEWAAATHGGHGRRGWKKLHLGVDRSGVIVAHALTAAAVDDAATAIALISAVGGRRRLAVVGRPEWRTPSSGTSRSSGVLFGLAVHAGRGPRQSSRAPSSIR